MQRRTNDTTVIVWYVRILYYRLHMRNDLGCAHYVSGLPIYFDTRLVLRCATGWTVRGSNPRGGRDFPRAPKPGIGTHPTYYIVDIGSLPRTKRVDRGADHPPPSSAEVKERVGYNSTYSPSRPSWPVMG
jgi:hypothetical protein